MKKRMGNVVSVISLTVLSAVIFSGCVVDQFARMFNDCCFSPAAFLPLGFIVLFMIHRYHE